MSFLKRLYSGLVTLITVIVMVFAIIMVVPRLFGINCYVVKSGSMEPALSVGDLAFVNTKKTSPETNEIAIYRINDSTFVCHRVMKKTDNGYVFKGDANKSADSAMVKKENIVGTYIFGIPKTGYILAWFNKFRIFMLILLLIALNISVIAINNLSENKKVN